MVPQRARPRENPVAPQGNFLAKLVCARRNRQPKTGIEKLVVEVDRAHAREFGLRKPGIVPRLPMVRKLRGIVPGDQLNPVHQSERDANRWLRENTQSARPHAMAGQ